MSAVGNAVTISSVRYVMVNNVLYVMPVGITMEKYFRMAGVKWKPLTQVGIGFDAG